jgi:SOS-response transcriptional repressor LexA
MLKMSYTIQRNGSKPHSVSVITPFALEVKGDSMTNPNGLPTIPEGATVIVDPDIEPLHGKIVIARIDGTNEAQ